MSSSFEMRFHDSLTFAVICSSNMNRSMEAHAFLAKKGFNVKSFGTGEKVRIPGPSIEKPNVYDFGTPYELIYQDLLGKDKILYTQTGMLHMVDRNRRVKAAPQRFQETQMKFDVVFTCEERVFDQVVQFIVLDSETPLDTKPVHVINLEIADNQEDATIGAFLFHRLTTMLCFAEDLDNEIDEILIEFQAKIGRSALHCVHFY